MPLEIGDYITDLVITNPLNTDDLSEADDHLRLIKKTVQQSFPNIDGAVTTGVVDLNAVAGLATALSGRFVELQWLRTEGPGLWTPGIPQAEISSLWAAVFGGSGGGGGGTGGAGNDRSGGGGGGGGLSISMWDQTETAALPWSSGTLNYQIGLSGAGSTGSGDDATDGTESWFASAAILQANPGLRGRSSSTASGSPGAGGPPGIGKITLPGGNGSFGPPLANNAISGGGGGMVPMFGTHRATPGEGNGNDGVLAGGDGGARQAVSGSATSGGKGDRGGLLTIIFGGPIS